MDWHTVARSSLITGRERELASLWGQLEAACNGRLGVTLVVGEPGIGKTRLLDELGVRARLAGVSVLRGGASMAEGMPPYLPFLEALGQHIQTVPAEQLREQAGAGAVALATLLPELASRLGELTPAYPLPAEQARVRLYEAMGTFLAAIADTFPAYRQADSWRGLVLILDDLHWADAASLDLLCYIARRQPGARLLAVGAYQEGESGQNPALERALSELAHLRVLTTITVPPLSLAEVEALVTRYLGGSVDPAVYVQLHKHSEGNPFFAEELLRDWLESSVLEQKPIGPSHQTRWTLSNTPGRELAPTIAGAIRQRLARLPSAVVDQLRIAAIIGRTFTPCVLAEVQQREVEEVEELLLKGVRAHLIRTRPHGDFSFTHDNIRECLYAEVSSARRRRLHGKIGLALEAQADDKDAYRVADLAFHFSHGDDRARGVSYSRRAAETALRAGASMEALAHYQAALDLLPSGDGQRGELLMGLGEAALLAAAEGQAVSAFTAAQAWYESAGDPVGSAHAAHGLSLAHWRQDAPELAEQALHTALARLNTGGEPGPDMVRVLVDLAVLLGDVLGRQNEAFGYGRQALDLARRLRDNHLQAAASRAVGFSLVRDNDLPAGLELLQEAVALADRTDDLFEAAECCACLSQAYCWSAQFDLSRQVSLHRLEIAQRSQQPYHLCYVHTWLAFLRAAQGDWLEAEQLLTEAQPAVEQVASSEPLAFWKQVRGFLAYQRGDYESAVRELEAANDTFRRHYPGEFLLCIGLLGLALLAEGRQREAHECLAVQTKLLETPSVGRLPGLSAAGCIALAAVILDDGDRAAHYYPSLMNCQGQYHWFLVDRILGEIAALRGNWLAAEKHLAVAASIAVRERLQPEMGRILAAQAEMELRRGGAGSVTRARTLWGQALGLLEQLGMSGEARRVRERMHHLPPQPGARAHIDLPVGLSNREAEVLRLVAAGKSNREIATTLALSENTIAKHLTSIYNKTGVDNRSAATAFAIRHGLA